MLAHISEKVEIVDEIIYEYSLINQLKFISFTQVASNEIPS